MTFPKRRKHPRFNGAAADHAATELLAAITPAPEDGATYEAPWRPPGERFADPRTWRGENDIGVMAIAITQAPPLDDYQPEPASFPALAAVPEPRDILPPVPITEPAVIGDKLKLPAIWCEMGGCIGLFLDEESAGFADARDRAAQAGWCTDALGRFACPDCQQSRSDYWTPQPLTWQHKAVPRQWYERGTVPTEETQERLTGAAEYDRYVSRKRPDWAAAMAGATHRTAAS